MCVCLLACVCASVWCVCVCVHLCIRACVHACVCVCVCVCMHLCISHLFVCVCICNILNRIWCSVHTLTMEHTLLCACGLAHVSWSIIECILCLCRCCTHHCTSTQQCHFSFPDRILQQLHCCGICRLVCLPVLACCHHCPGTSVRSGSCQP